MSCSNIFNKDVEEILNSMEKQLEEFTTKVKKEKTDEHELLKRILWKEAMLDFDDYGASSLSGLGVMQKEHFEHKLKLWDSRGRVSVKKVVT